MNTNLYSWNFHGWATRGATLAGLLALLTLGGCSAAQQDDAVAEMLRAVGVQSPAEQQLSPIEAAKVLVAAVQGAQDEKVPDSPAKPSGEKGESLDILEADTGLKKLLGDFQTPFPLREDPFQQPRLEQTEAGRSDSKDSTVRSVTLRGFVNVDGRRALVEIDNILVAIGEGEERDGVKVLEIQPPRVTLQRGRVRWQETLDSPPS